MALISIHLKRWKSRPIEVLRKIYWNLWSNYVDAMHQSSKSCSSVIQCSLLLDKPRLYLKRSVACAIQKLMSNSMTSWMGHGCVSTVSTDYPWLIKVRKYNVIWSILHSSTYLEEQNLIVPRFFRIQFVGGDRFVKNFGHFEFIPTPFLLACMSSQLYTLSYLILDVRLFGDNLVYCVSLRNLFFPLNFVRKKNSKPDKFMRNLINMFIGDLRS